MRNAAGSTEADRVSPAPEAIRVRAGPETEALRRLGAFSGASGRRHRGPRVSPPCRNVEGNTGIFFGKLPHVTGDTVCPCRQALMQASLRTLRGSPVPGTELFGTVSANEVETSSAGAYAAPRTPASQKIFLRKHFITEFVD